MNLQEMNKELLEEVTSLRNQNLNLSKKNKELRKQLTIPIVSGCLICIMDNVEGDGLTKGMKYKILAEKDCMYCIVDDNNNLGVYGEIFFDKE